MHQNGAAAAAVDGAIGDVMSGFPPPPALQVNLANWQQPGYLRWAFRHMREVIPTHGIAAGTPHPLPARGTGTGSVDDIAVALTDEFSSALSSEPIDVAGVLAATYTDGILVLRDGTVVAEGYFEGMTPSTRHLVMSVSKSIVGCVAGVLAERGQLDLQAAVTDYVPEVGESGYRHATVRDVLDMRTGVAFRETYALSDSEVRIMERSMGWAPRLPEDPYGAYAYLATIGESDPPGGEFVYRSCDTDMLGWICERAAGVRMADLISTLLWQPLGAEFDAEITCDPVGSAIHDGGVCSTLRDLGRFGQMLLDEGMAGDRRVVPASWVADAFNPDPGVREAFAHTDNEPMLPGGWYRDQFWFYRRGGADAESSPEGSPVLLCLGIHGQMVYVDRPTRTVVVKMSSWPDAQNAVFLAATLRACEAIAAALPSEPEPAEPADEPAPRKRKRPNWFSGR